MTEFRYLIPHAGSEELYSVCKDSIAKHTPGEIISVGREIKNWPEAFKRLWDSWNGVAVFMDDDCILLRDIRELIESVAGGTYDLVGVEEVIPSPDGYMRNAPGYYSTNFMIIDIGKFKQKFGDKIDVDIDIARREIPEGRSIEPPYGISQKLRGGNILSLTPTLTNYGFATKYGEYAVHLWYGAWKHRKTVDVSFDVMAEREKKFIKDYWDNQLDV